MAFMKIRFCAIIIMGLLIIMQYISCVVHANSQPSQVVLLHDLLPPPPYNSPIFDVKFDSDQKKLLRGIGSLSQCMKMALLYCTNGGGSFRFADPSCYKKMSMHCSKLFPKP